MRNEIVKNPFDEFEKGEVLQAEFSGVSNSFRDVARRFIDSVAEVNDKIKVNFSNGFEKESGIDDSINNKIDRDFESSYSGPGF